MSITCLVALLAVVTFTVISSNLQEDVFGPVSGVFALFFWLVTVFTAPLILKLILLLTPFIWLQIALRDM